MEAHASFVSQPLGRAEGDPDSHLPPQHPPAAHHGGANPHPAAPSPFQRFQTAQGANLSPLTLPRRPGFRAVNRWVAAAHGVLARRQTQALDSALQAMQPLQPRHVSYTPPQHAASAALSSGSSMEPTRGGSPGPTAMPHLPARAAHHRTPLPPPGVPNQGTSSRHVHSPLHCPSAGLLHVPEAVKAIQQQQYAHGLRSALTLTAQVPSYVLGPAASMAGAAAAQIVNSVANAAMQAASPLPLGTPMCSQSQAASEVTATDAADQQQQVCPLGLTAATLAANMAAAAVTAANVSSLPTAAADPLCTGAMAIGASAAAIAAGLTFLPSPATLPQQVGTGAEPSACSQVLPTAEQPNINGAVAAWDAHSELHPEQQLQLLQPALEDTSGGLALCSFCGGERPCHAPCPLAVATAALQGLHLQGIYATGRFRVACFVGDKPSSAATSPCPSLQATPRASPTCSPTASSHSLCSGIGLSSGLSSPCKALAAAAATASAAAHAHAHAPAAAFAQLAPTSHADSHASNVGLPPSLQLTYGSPSPPPVPVAAHDTGMLQLRQSDGRSMQHEPGMFSPTSAGNVASLAPRSSEAGSSHADLSRSHPHHQQQQQGGAGSSGNAGGSGGKPKPPFSSRHSSKSLTGKLQRKGRFMVVEYNDLVDAAKAAAMVAMVSAGEEDGGEAAAKAAAMNVVRDAAQPMPGSLASCTSVLNMADPSCMLPPMPDPLPLVLPAPVAPTSALNHTQGLFMPASPEVTTQTAPTTPQASNSNLTLTLTLAPGELAPQPAAAAAAAVAAAAVLDHAASSIAHAAISAATGAPPPPPPGPLLAFELPEHQQQALAVMGWPGTTLPGTTGTSPPSTSSLLQQPQPQLLLMQAAEEAGIKAALPTTTALLPGLTSGEYHPPSPFLMQGFDTRPSALQVPGSFSLPACESAPAHVGHVRATGSPAAGDGVAIGAGQLSSPAIRYQAAASAQHPQQSHQQQQALSATTGRRREGAAGAAEAPPVAKPAAGVAAHSSVQPPDEHKGQQQLQQQVTPPGELLPAPGAGLVVPAASAPAAALAPPPAPRAYRKGRFSIQEVAAPAASTSSGTGGPSTPTAAAVAVSGFSSASDSGTPRHAAIAPSTNDAPEAAGVPLCAPPVQPPETVVVTETGGTAAGSELATLPTVTEAAAGVSEAARHASGEQSQDTAVAMALVPVPTTGSSTQYAVAAVSPAVAASEGVAKRAAAQTAARTIERTASSHVPPATYAINIAPNSIIDLQARDASESAADSSSSAVTASGGSLQGQPLPQQQPATPVAAAGDSTQSETVTLTPDMRRNLTPDLVHASSAPTSPSARSGTGTVSAGSSMAGGVTSIASSETGGFGAGYGTETGTASAGTATGAAPLPIFSTPPRAMLPPRPLYSMPPSPPGSLGSRWLLHQSTASIRRTPAPYLLNDSSFRAGAGQLPGSSIEFPHGPFAMLRAASLGLGPRTPSADVVSFAEWVPHTNTAPSPLPFSSCVSSRRHTPDLSTYLLQPPARDEDAAVAAAGAPRRMVTQGEGRGGSRPHHRRLPARSWSWAGTVCAGAPPVVVPFLGGIGPLLGGHGAVRASGAGDHGVTDGPAPPAWGVSLPPPSSISTCGGGGGGGDFSCAGRVMPQWPDTLRSGDQAGAAATTQLPPAAGVATRQVPPATGVAVVQLQPAAHKQEAHKQEGGPSPLVPSDVGMAAAARSAGTAQQQRELDATGCDVITTRDTLRKERARVPASEPHTAHRVQVSEPHTIHREQVSEPHTAGSPGLYVVHSVAGGENGPMAAHAQAGEAGKGVHGSLAGASAPVAAAAAAPKAARKVGRFTIID